MLSYDQIAWLLKALAGSGPLGKYCLPKKTGLISRLPKCFQMQPRIGISVLVYPPTSSFVGVDGICV